MAATFEQMLFPAFNVVLAQDVQEFSPYVFQVLGLDIYDLISLLLYFCLLLFSVVYFCFTVVYGCLLLFTVVYITSICGIDVVNHH